MRQQVDTISAAIREHAGLRPSTTAVSCAGESVDYAALHRVSGQVANRLAADGIRPGDRIAYCGRESVRFYQLLIGALRRGAVLVPINWRLAPEEIAYVLGDSECRMLFTDEAPNAVPDHVVVVPLDRFGVRGLGFSTWLADADADAADIAATPDDAAVQLYTSGTTGLPKGVVLAQRSFLAVRRALRAAGLDWIDWYPADISLIAVPGYHVGGLWWAVQGLLTGATNVALREFEPGAVAELIRAQGVTTAVMVPAMMRLLLDEPGVNAAHFGSLRKVVYGGSPINEALLTRCRTIFGCELAQIYGLTETGATALCLPPADHIAGGSRLRSTGRPYPGFEVAVVDSAGAPLPPGAIGEVLLRTPAAMVEYWKLPEATAATLCDGWVRTGDAGTLDADGYLFLSDRIKDMIIVAGENVYPAEVERVLANHPAIAEVAVIGVPDERWGEAVHAFVVPAPGCTPAAHELTGFAQTRLAAHKCPHHIDFVTTLPRNAGGKVLRRELRKRYWDGQPRAIN